MCSADSNPITRLDAGQLEVERVIVPVEPIFPAIEAMVRPEMDTRGVQFSYRPCGPDVAALGDRDRIIQICLNLVTNAMRAMKQAGRVALRCVPNRDFLTIDVVDTGRGIPVDRFESIFAPLVQVCRALNAPMEGTGLRVAISHGLAEAMGGTLSVTSVLGEGSTFSLRFPTVEAPPPSFRAAERATVCATRRSVQHRRRAPPCVAVTTARGCRYGTTPVRKKRRSAARQA